MQKINLRKTDCPVCNTTGKYEKTEFEIICKKCGCIIITPYQYTAGIKFNRNIKFALKTIQRKKTK